MAYTLGQAAKATGKSKSGIALAISKGWIAATKNSQGQWQIEPAELHRVYRPLGDEMNDGSPHGETNRTAEIAHLKATLDGLEKLNQQIKDERDNLRDQNTRLTAMLSAPPPQTAKRVWWKFGRAT